LSRGLESLQVDRRGCPEGEGVFPLSDGRLRFACHSGVPCFTECCADLRLILTPYDILRMKNRLQISAEAFLERYTVALEDEGSNLPMVGLRMGEEPRRRCPFVSDEKGCRIYEDRPGACRLYPLGRASCAAAAGAEVESYFVVKEAHCLGFREPCEWTVEDWLVDQGIHLYNQMNRPWMEIITHAGKERLTEDKLRMFYLTGYNLDRFREFVMQTKFLDVFRLPSHQVEEIRTDDVALLKLGMQWLLFALYGQQTLPMD
jgi:Fe-S-cluster containining protein